jgi:hypothetical protein
MVGLVEVKIPSVARVDRINFSNDSVTHQRGPLSAGRYTLAATGNSNYGWFGGGYGGSGSRVDRIDFSNDSATALQRGSLSAGRYIYAATGNSNLWLVWWWTRCWTPDSSISNSRPYRFL